DAGQDVSSELLEGAELIHAAVGSGFSRTEDDLRLLEMAERVRSDAPAGEGGSRELLEGAELIHAAVGSGFSRTEDDLRLLEIADLLRSDAPEVARTWAAKDANLRALIDARPDRSASTTYDRTLPCVVDSV